MADDTGKRVLWQEQLQEILGHEGGTQKKGLSESRKAIGVDLGR